MLSSILYSRLTKKGINNEKGIDYYTDCCCFCSGCSLFYTGFTKLCSQSRRAENNELRVCFFLNTQKRVTESEAGVNDEEEKKELWTNTVDGEDPVAIVMNQALEIAKEFKVQLIKAKEANFKLSDAERKEINQNLNNWLKNEENRDYVKNKLGISIRQFKDVMVKSQLVSRFAYDYMQKHSDAVTVTDEEAEQYYNENRKNLDDVTVTYIFVSADENMDSGQKAEKRKLAEEILEKIRQGTDMASLVKEYSEDPGVNESDGTYTFKYSSESHPQEVKDWRSAPESGIWVLFRPKRDIMS